MANKDTVYEFVSDNGAYRSHQFATYDECKASAVERAEVFGQTMHIFSCRPYATNNRAWVETIVENRTMPTFIPFT